MHVMPNHPFKSEHTVTQKKSTQARGNAKALMADDWGFVRQLVREAVQLSLEAER